MRELLTSRWTYSGLRLAGYVLLGMYLVGSNDWRLSLTGVVAYPVAMFGVAALLVRSRIGTRWPRLSQYELFSPRASAGPIDDREWTRRKAEYLASGLRGLALLHAPAEDGLICVPVLLAGISPVTAAAGGLAFGALHLARFTLLECIGKAIGYALVCYWILPLGILTVVAGHFLTDLIGALLLKAVTRNEVDGHA